MDTLVIEVTNRKAYQLLKQLEELHIIRVLKNGTEPKQKLSEKYRGKLHLSKEESLEFHKYIQESRDEWERNI